MKYGACVHWGKPASTIFVYKRRAEYRPFSRTRQVAYHFRETFESQVDRPFTAVFHVAEMQDAASFAQSRQDSAGSTEPIAPRSPAALELELELELVAVARAGTAVVLALVVAASEDIEGMRSVAGIVVGKVVDRVAGKAAGTAAGTVVAVAEVGRTAVGLVRS